MERTNPFGPISPSEKDSETARASGLKLAALLRERSDDLKVRVEEESVAVPASAFRLLVEILNQMALGNSLTLIPVHAELTTQEAADQLSVSRPFFVKLLEEGKIPFHKVGTHRRVYFKDLMEYKSRAELERLKVLQELQKDAQENDLGY